MACDGGRTVKGDPIGGTVGDIGSYELYPYECWPDPVRALRRDDLVAVGKGGLYAFESFGWVIVEIVVGTGGGTDTEEG